MGKSCGGLKFKFVAHGEGEETVFGVCQVVDFGQSPIVSGIYHHVHVLVGQAEGYRDVHLLVAILINRLLAFLW